MAKLSEPSHIPSNISFVFLGVCFGLLVVSLV